MRDLSTFGSALVATAAGPQAIGGTIGFAILLILLVSVLVRLIVVLLRRGKNGVKKEVLGPALQSGGVQSELYGFKPTEAPDLQPDERSPRPDEPDRGT